MENDCLMGTGIFLGGGDESVLELEHFSVLTIVVMVTYHYECIVSQQIVHF